MNFIEIMDIASKIRAIKQRNFKKIITAAEDYRKVSIVQFQKILNDFSIVIDILNIEERCVLLDVCGDFNDEEYAILADIVLNKNFDFYYFPSCSFYKIAQTICRLYEYFKICKKNIEADFINDLMSCYSYLEGAVIFLRYKFFDYDIVYNIFCLFDEQFYGQLDANFDADYLMNCIEEAVRYRKIVDIENTFKTIGLFYNFITRCAAANK